MDQNVQQQPVTPQPTQPQVPQTVQKISPLPKIVLSVLGVIIVLGLIGGAYYLGAKNKSISYKPQATPTIVPTTIPPIATNTPVASPSPVLQNLVAGGVDTFAKYQINFPNDWQTNETNTTSGDIVTLTKAAYQLKISQGAFDGGACSYPDKQLTEGIFQSFTSFTEIKDQNNTQYRRGKLAESGLPGQDKYEVCALSAKNNIFQEFTPFGRIDYITPTSADSTMLSEMDSIVASLKSQ